LGSVRCWNRCTGTRSRQVGAVLGQLAPGCESSVPVDAKEGQTRGPDVDEAEPVGHSGGELERPGQRVAVDDEMGQRRWVRLSVPPLHEDVIPLRIEALARFEHDDAAVETGRELLDVVQMGVIDEGARLGRVSRAVNESAGMTRGARCSLLPLHPATPSE
jgi:hypothetical protein